MSEKNGEKIKNWKSKKFSKISILIFIFGLFIFSFSKNIVFARDFIIRDVSSSTNVFFMVQGTSGKVGVGTATPTYKLDVVGDIRATGVIIGTVSTTISATNVSAGAFGANTGGGNYSFPANLTVSGNVGIGTTSPGATLHVRQTDSGQTPSNVVGLFVENNGSLNNYYVFQTATVGGGKSFSITNAGNVGIGTTAPNNKLDVNGHIGILGGNYLRLYKNDNSAYASIQYDSTNNAVSANYPWRFTDTGTHYIAGNVGIGTTEPLGKLQIEGDVRGYIISSNRYPVGLETNILFNAVNRYSVSQSGSTSLSLPMLFDGKFEPSYSPDGIDPSNPLVILIENLPDTHTQIGAWVGWTTRYWAPSKFKIEGYDINQGYNNWRTIVDYSTTNYSGGYECLIKIPISGQYTKLKFTIYEGTGSVGSNGYKRVGLSEIFFLHPEVNRIYSGILPSSMWEVNSNVGIGTTSPSVKLHVYESDTAKSGALINIATTSSSYYSLNVQSGGTSRLYVRADGNVGIGTTSPSEKLMVSGGKLRVDSASSSWGQVQLGNPSGTETSLAFLNNNGSAIDYSTPTNNNTAFIMGINPYNVGTTNWALTSKITTATPIILATQSGNVGIGTTNPSYKLDVSGDIRATGTIYGTFSGTINAANVSAGSFGANTGGGNYSFPANLTVDTNTFFVDATNDRVGIATTTPAYPLDVVGDVRFSGTLQGGSVPWARLTSFPSACSAGNAVTGLGTTLTCSPFMSNPMTTLGDIVYGGASGVPTRLAGAAGFLKSTGAAAPSWSAVNLASSDVTGVLPIASGGTNATSTPTAGAVAYGTGSAYAFTAAGTASQLLISGGSGAPTWSNIASLLTQGTNITISGTTNATIATVNNPTFSTSVSTPLLTSSGAIAIKPGSNSTTAIQLQNTSGTAIVNVDTTNSRVGIATTTPAYPLDVVGDVRFSGTLQGGSVPWARLTSFPSACSAGNAVTGLGTTLTCSPFMSNPMTTLGDIVYGGASGVPTRLAGAAGFLKSTGAAAPSWSAVNLASSDVTGTLQVTSGGTGLSSIAAGSILYATSSNTLVAIAPTAANQVLRSTAANALQFGALVAADIPNLDASKITSGTFGISRGGTNSTATPTAGAVAYGTGSAYAFTAAGTASQLLISGGSGAPTWSNIASLLTQGTNITISGTTNATIATVNNPTFSTSVSTPLLTSSGAIAIKPGSNSTTAIQLQNTSGTAIVNVDTTNSRVGINNTNPSYALDVTGDLRVTGAIIGTVSTTISATNVSAGAFGANTGGGNYSFPARVGIGTTSPSTDLHIKVSSGDVKIQLGTQASVVPTTGGPNNPSAAVDDSSNGGSAAWSNPTNVYTSNDVYASVSIPGGVDPDYYYSDYLKATGFGFSLPSSANVLGIKVEIEGKASLASTVTINEVLLVKSGSIVGSSKSGGLLTASDAYYSFGDTTDLWGTTWSYSDINNSNFGVVVSVFNPTTSARTAYIDHIRITVYYTSSGDADWQMAVSSTSGAFIINPLFSGGRVGIGTTTPSATLDINGTLNVNGIIQGKFYDKYTGSISRTYSSGNGTSSLSTGKYYPDWFCALSKVDATELDTATEHAYCTVTLDGNNQWLLNAVISGVSDQTVSCSIYCIRL